MRCRGLEHAPIAVAIACAGKVLGYTGALAKISPDLLGKSSPPLGDSERESFCQLRRQTALPLTELKWDCERRPEQRRLSKSALLTVGLALAQDHDVNV